MSQDKDIKEIKDTGSRAQNLLRAGFDTSCEKGIANLLKVDDMTIEACEDFIPTHEKELEIFIKNEKERIRKNSRWLKDEKIRLALSECEWWELLKMQKIKKFKFPELDITHEVGIRKLDIKEGHLTTPVTFTYTIKGSEELGISDLVRNSINRHVTVGRKGYVDYVLYDTYADRMLEDHIVIVVKEAIDMGIEDVHIAFPKIKDGNPIDPIIVGWLYEHNERNEVMTKQMWIIVWFGYDKNDPKACNM